MRSLINDRDNSLIIAEAGVNHNGDKSTAFSLVDIAVEAGADAVKFQTFCASKVASPNAPKAQYQIDNTANAESQIEMLKKLELPYEWHLELQDYCKDRGIMFVSTPFHREAADFLLSINVPFLKISSTDLNNLPFLSYLATKNIPLLISTGMSTMDEVTETAQSLSSAGCTDWAFLHCLSQYPAPFEEANLRAIPAMQAALNCPVGYSDHTQGLETAIAAIALGATIIEKHFTLDHCMEGPDHKASANPEELAEYITAIRRTEKALGDGNKVCQPSEISTRDMARKSVTATASLPAGHNLQEEDLTLLRPSSGIAPKHLPQLIGRKLKSNVKAGQTLSWTDLA